MIFNGFLSLHSLVVDLVYFEAIWLCIIGHNSIVVNNTQYNVPQLPMTIIPYFNTVIINNLGLLQSLPLSRDFTICACRAVNPSLVTKISKYVCLFKRQQPHVTHALHTYVRSGHTNRTVCSIVWC